MRAQSVWDTCIFRVICFILSMVISTSVFAGGKPSVRKWEGKYQLLPDQPAECPPEIDARVKSGGRTLMFVYGKEILASYSDINRWVGPGDYFRETDSVYTAERSVLRKNRLSNQFRISKGTPCGPCLLTGKWREKEYSTLKENGILTVHTDKFLKHEHSVHHICKYQRVSHLIPETQTVKVSRSPDFDSFESFSN